jgi:hypothetical protein
MKIAYNHQSDIYHIDLEYPETEIYIKANEISETKDLFVAYMASMFEEALREQLQDKL